MRRLAASASRPPHRSAVLLAATLVLGAAGCGSGAVATETNVRLQREDLIATAHALAQARGQVATEVAATRAAWPTVANGLPMRATGAQSRAVAQAETRAAGVRVPSLFKEATASGLTGPGASIAGTFRNFAGLATTGWKMVSYALASDRLGASQARFARANSPLYIESVYDAHFGLSQIGKKLQSGYAKLGGAPAFGRALTPAEVDALATAYSEPSARLHPHPGVKLGS